ncbi:hypothetical protein cpu_23300 [Carboxydothermus pertinax]|uniref:Uncharacterized protein n=1 Tax=Carboxydothermus pertinax TaxID=870242 RepID=A0A1L8CY32_9THEO|nr:hypothetical protein cpu_23300 [Carboxydothermus pertinax]
MGEKNIKTGLRPGGKERLSRLLRLIETGKIDPTPLTTHKFSFSELEKAFNLRECK